METKLVEFCLFGALLSAFISHIFSLYFAREYVLQHESVYTSIILLSCLLQYQGLGSVIFFFFFALLTKC